METLELLKKIDEDVELQKKFEGVNTPEKFYEIAKENGLTDDFDTMKAAAAKELNKNGAINEKDLSVLSEVSGGVSSEDVVSTLAVSSITGLASASFSVAITGSSAAI